MAGKKQHFIPKHFLKEFVVPDGSDTLWMFRRESPKPVPVSRSNAAAMRYFYSKPNNSNTPTLDDIITKYEDQLKSSVEAVRSIPKGEKIPTHLISEIAAHLMVRAQYVREIVNSCFSATIESLGELADPNGPIFEGLETNRHRVPSEFEDEVIRKIKNHRIIQSTSISPKTAAQIIYFRLRENSYILKDLIEPEMSQLISQLKSGSKDISRKSHIDVLQSELAPATWKARLEKFDWRVIEHPTANAILPDCVVISKDITGWSPYLTSYTNTVTQVALPIAADRIAVGCLDQSQNVVADMYNQAAQSCCFNFYLSNDPKQTLDRNNIDIGDNMRSRIENLVSGALRKPIKDFFGGTTDTDKHSPSVRFTDLISKSFFPYSLHCDDFADRHLLRDLGDQLNCIIALFADSYPIYSLGGFSFLNDYNELLQRLDRGDGIDRRFVGDKSDGIALPTLVEQKNIVKTHVILKPEIAKCLLSKREEAKSRAVSAIVYCLGSVAFYALIDGKFPGMLLTPTKNTYEDYLYQYNDDLLPLCCPYFLFGAKNANIKVLANHALEYLDELVVKTFEAHNECKVNFDRQVFFKKSAYHISSFLFSIARFVGAAAVTEEPEMLSSNLDARLRRLGLSQWFKLFERDLLAFYRNLDDWKNWEDVYFINRHFERILFDVGIITEKSVGGSLGFIVHDKHKLSTNANSVL